MEGQLKKESILTMAQGAIEEKVDYEVSRVIDNILDPNTKPDAKRKVTITLEFVPDAERRRIAISATAKSVLVPATAAVTAVVVTTDGNGELVVAEMVPQIPGQISMTGEVQAPPKILKLVNQ